MVLSILIVDNNDSFTYNLVELLRQTGKCRVEVVRVEDAVNVNPSKFNGIILSPGPGLPNEKIGLYDFVDSIDGTIPLFGVCLGHQAIASYYGGKLSQLNEILHGETSEVFVDESDLIFKGLGTQMQVGRYHSWIVDRESLPECFKIISSTKTGTIMGLRHVNKNICTVQFHPESILTPKGQKLIENWLDYCVLENIEQ